MAGRSAVHATAHATVVAAPATAVYDLVADVTRWPVIFEPTVDVRLLEHTGDHERFQLWARVNDEVRTWTSRRELDRRRLRITFEQEHSVPPLASMGGEWEFRQMPGGRTEVLLTHRFSVLGGDDQVVWTTRALDANSGRELAALGRVAESGHPVDELVFSFVDEVRLPGTAAEAYAFVHRSELWPQRLPHVGRVLLREPQPGVQDMEMDTVTGDGAAHTTRSVRLCRPTEEIVYKQLVPPALLFGHSGAWRFADGPDGTAVTARHTVAINPAAVPDVLGAGSTVADARRYLRRALGANSRATLEHAGAEARQQAAVPVDGGAVG